jgi:apolipoprotein D and lipocalin family protein
MSVKKILIGLSLFAAGTIVLTNCVGIPDGVNAVQNFQKEKYLGKWYEIARLDYKYEKDLDNTTANYSIQDDGTIKVENKGYNVVTKEWKSATGKAKFVGSDKEGRLKVSFFGPFYSGYNVVDIDENYQHALIYGSSTKYIWILSKTPHIDEAIKKRFIEKAEKDGYDTSKLIWVKHDK